MTDEAVPAAQPTPAAGPHVALQKVYLKDASIEIPQAPAIFTRQEQPSIDIQMNTAAQNLGNDNYQVTLSVTLTAKMPGGDIAFLVEAHQAGIFSLRNMESAEQLQFVLASFCPQNIFPYARESVGDLVQRAGFPSILLQPVNFEALYMAQRNQQAAQAQQADVATA